MIKVDLYSDWQGYITAYKVSGHAEAAQNGEYDLVCNTVSVLTQSPVIGLERHLKRKPSYSVNEKDGILEVKLDGLPDEQTQTLLMSMYYSLKDLAAQLPQYVRIQNHRR